MKKRSERESGRVGILRGFPDLPHSEEFEVADRQSLGLEQQVAQVLVADPERHGDRRGGDLGPPSRPCVSSSNWRGNDWGPAVLSDYRYQVITPSGKPTATHLSRATFRIGEDLTGADWTLPTRPFPGSFRPAALLRDDNASTCTLFHFRDRRFT